MEIGNLAVVSIFLLKMELDQVFFLLRRRDSSVIYQEAEPQEILCSGTQGVEGRGWGRESRHGCMHIVLKCQLLL